jgi:hypothetical protein
MNINKINFSQSFGLYETDTYKTMQNSLIKAGTKNISHMNLNAKLDFLPKVNKFILTTPEDTYQVGSIKENPFETLAILYQNLSDFSHGGGSGCKPLKSIKNDK